MHDLVVIGGGTAGLTAAVGAAGVGARVLLAEEHRTGGDCLWTGCIPSKALIATARRAHAMRTANEVGLEPAEPRVDLSRVMRRVHETIATVQPHDSPERLQREGVEVVPARARFLGNGLLDVGGRRVRTRSTLLATGSTPFLPPIDGLADADPLTTDSLWHLDRMPSRLLVIGGGAVGCELGQAMARLGSAVTIVEMANRLLPDAEPEASAVVAASLAADGIDVRVGTQVVSVAPGEVVVEDPAGRHSLATDRILAAAGRRPATDDLGLDLVHVARDAAGHVLVDDTMRTSARHVFAAGDVTGRMLFTHVASAHGGVVVTNALFGLHRRVDHEAIPWAVFTDPEVASVGPSVSRAHERWGEDAVIIRIGLDHVDRALTESQTRGMVVLVADPRERLVGATVVGVGAGETIAELVAWVRTGSRLRDVAEAVHAYPTMSIGPWEGIRTHLRDRYLSPAVRRAARPVLFALRHLSRSRR